MQIKFLPDKIFRNDDVKCSKDLEYEPKYTAEWILACRDYDKYLDEECIGNVEIRLDEDDKFDWNTLSKVVNLYPITYPTIFYIDWDDPKNKLIPHKMKLKMIEATRVDNYFKKKIGVGIITLGLVTSTYFDNFVEAEAICLEDWIRLTRPMAFYSLDVKDKFFDHPEVKDLKSRFKKYHEIKHYPDVLNQFLEDKALNSVDVFNLGKEIPCKCGKNMVLIKNRFGTYYRCSCKSCKPYYITKEECKCGGERQLRVVRAGKLVNVCSKYPNCPEGLNFGY